MQPEEAVSNMGPIVLFALIGLRIISIPIGVGVFILIRRMMPAVTVTSVSIIAGYIVGVVVLFVLIRQVFGLIWYDTASISLVITAGVVFYITYTIKRSLFKPSRSMEAETGFKVFGEDAKQKPKNLRRRKR